jgi:hypothetical protein
MKIEIKKIKRRRRRRKLTLWSGKKKPQIVKKRKMTDRLQTKQVQREKIWTNARKKYPNSRTTLQSTHILLNYPDNFSSVQFSSNHLEQVQQ